MTNQGVAGVQEWRVGKAAPHYSNTPLLNYSITLFLSGELTYVDC